jgi:hypothetical protein
MTDQGEKLEALTRDEVQKHVNVLDDHLGMMVRNVWVDWATDQPNPKPHWLVPWDKLSEPDREVDRLIGRALFDYGVGIAIRADIQRRVESILRTNRRSPPVGAGGLMDYGNLTLDDVKRAVIAWWKPSNTAYTPDEDDMANMADALHAALAGRQLRRFDGPALSEAQAIQPQDRTAAGDEHPTPPEGQLSSPGILAYWRHQPLSKTT